MALSATVDGQTTAHYVADTLSKHSVEVVVWDTACLLVVSWITWMKELLPPLSVHDKKFSFIVFSQFFYSILTLYLGSLSKDYDSKKILTAPDPFLKQISKPVDEVTKEIQDLMDDMLDTMYDAPGIGLAAVQIGVPLRVIVMDISWRNEEGIKSPFILLTLKLQ